MKSLRTPTTGKNELGETVRLLVITRHLDETTYETTMWGRAVIDNSSSSGQWQAG